MRLIIQPDLSGISNWAANYIATDTPDFHRPEFFGEIYF